MDAVLTDRRIERWQLNRLKAHPQQQHIFRAPKPEEIDRLAESMKSEPSTTLVEILPDGTIVCGHSRAQAARQLGWTELDVWVRDDLAARGEAAVLHRLINDNFNRRQLSPLDQARCLQRLFELEKETKQRGKGKGNLRDIVAAQHKMSGRNLERYLNVLKTPMEVQVAFDEKQLSLTKASRVAGMKAEDQKQVVEAIARGESPREAVQRMLAQDKSWKQKPENGTVSFLRPLETWRQKMKVRLPEIKTVNPDDAETIRKLMRVLNELLGKCHPDADRGKQEKAETPQAVQQAGAREVKGEATSQAADPRAADRRIKPGKTALVPAAPSRQERHG